MNFKEIFQQLNITVQCKKYGFSFWQCPQFLFLIMGLVVAIAAVTTYLIGTRYVADPLLVAFIVLIITAILLIIAFTITQSFERLAEANRMKSEFINIVSHQLRSPLSNLKWVLEILTSGRLGKIEEPQTEYFRILKENAGRMGELIKDLLIVSRIETQTLPSKKEKISLLELINKIVQDFEPFARASNVKVTFHYEKNLPQIIIDLFQLRQVIENLLDNAIRYIKDKGEIEIKIEGQRKAIYFEIKDTGVGIPKEDQKYIFQKFFRSANIMKYQTEGSGLGLYIAKAIIEKSGGKIGFLSQEGKGSTFWFTIPIK